MSTRKAGHRKGRTATRRSTGAVVPRGHRGNGRRERRRPSQNTNGSGGGDRHTKRGAAKRAAVAGRGWRRCRRPSQKKAGGRCRRPLQGAGGGRDDGCHMNNALGLRQDASTGAGMMRAGSSRQGVARCFTRPPVPTPLPSQVLDRGRLGSTASASPTIPTEALHNVNDDDVAGLGSFKQKSAQALAPRGLLKSSYDFLCLIYTKRSKASWKGPGQF